MVRVIIYGFGFMGRVHARCFLGNPRAKVVAIIDLNVERARQNGLELGLDDVPVASDLDEVLSTVKADILDLCLPTDAHADAAEAGFAAGLHVFCEKPIALDLDAARRITDAADIASKQLMIGHCLRFWPEYLELKQMILSGDAGALRALNLFRRAPRPDYSAENWVNDPSRCLGAALDLHIHDTDFVHFLLGAPEAVFSNGVQLSTGWDHIQTQYLFTEGPIVQAEGGWTYPADRAFQMGFCALFENGSLDFDNTASRTLLKRIGRQTIDLSAVPGREVPGHLAGLEGYENQIDYFISRIAANQTIQINTGEDATASLRTVLSEIRSAEDRALIEVPKPTECALS